MKQESIYSVLIDIETNSEISTKARNSISEFVDNVIGTLRTMREVYPVSKLIEKVIESIDYYGYIDELYKGDKEEAEERKDNVKEFISVAMEFEQNSEEKDLETFLTGVALTSESSEEEEIDKVSLMTIHTSKGLEFPVVFIVGMEDGLFPIARAVRSMSDSK